MYAVQVNVPHLAEGGTIEIDGLGIFTQGETTEVSDADVEFFRQKHTKAGKSMQSLRSLLKDSGITITSTGAQQPLEEDPDVVGDTNTKEGE